MTGLAFSMRFSGFGIRLGVLCRVSGLLFAVVAGMGMVTLAAEPPGKLVHALPKPYFAPRLTGIKAWLNSPPLSSSDLKGKVVLIDFWTYSCVNCIRTLPYLKDWYAKYAKDGLVIVGVHSPEFAFENDRANVAKAIAKYGIAYPVAMDNDKLTWTAFKNRYWPAHYLIDRQGRVVYTHFGEGEYGVTENNIRVLLGQSGPGTPMAARRETSYLQTPETYLGRSRAEREVRDGDPPLNGWSLAGNWTRRGEYIEAAAAGATLTLHYRARKVFLVMACADGKPKPLEISEGGKTRTLTVTDSELYGIAEAPSLHEGTLVLRAGEAGLRLYAFTFGG